MSQPGKPFRLAVFLRSQQVSAWNFQSRHAQKILASLPSCRITECSDEKEFAAALACASGGAPLAAVSWRYEQTWIDAAADLRVLATPAAGKDYFSVLTPDAVSRINGHFHGQLMAETALGLLLGHARGIFVGGQRMRQGEWPRKEIDELARPLRGSHLVIVGFGRIGEWIAKLAKPFGVRITGIRRNPAAAVRPSFFDPHDRILPLTELDAILPQTDHLFLVLPGGFASDGLLDASRLAKLPSHAAVYNFGRGNAIDEPALITALQENRISGAYLDVYAHEPLPANSILRSLPNAWLLPHSSAIAPNYLDLFIEELIPQLQQIFC